MPPRSHLDRPSNGVIPLRFTPWLGFLWLTLAWMTPYTPSSAQTPPTPFKAPPHAYWTRPTTDPLSQLLLTPSLSSTPTPDSPLQSLRRLLDALHISVHSQLLVYSATSLQSGLIHPTNPRALYFNDETYVGYVPGGHVEIAAIDPGLGPIFHLSNSEAEFTGFSRSQRCMNCHAGRATEQLPGLLTESVLCTHTGASLDGFRREQVGHQIPLSERLGGWHVTGSLEHGPHLGNLTAVSAPGGYRKVPNPPGAQFAWSSYLTHTSDLLPHLLHEHQLGFHNLVTLALYRTREALLAGHGSIQPDDDTHLRQIAHRLVRYLLFADEAPLPQNGFTPLEAYRTAFLSQRRPAKDGRSLRDLNLHSRLFEFRCSYMIYTPGFQALPRPMLERIQSALKAALDNSPEAPPEFNYLPASEKNAIRTILAETNALP